MTTQSKVMRKAWEIYREYNMKSMSFWSKSLKEAWAYIRFDNRKVSEIEIPKCGSIHVPNATTALSMHEFSSHYDWNYQQLEDWKKEMINRWGDITLKIWVVSGSLIRYQAQEDSEFGKFLRADSMAISETINR